MKRCLFVFVALVFLAASPINSSDFVEGDVFFMDGSEFSVLTTLAEGLEVRTPAGGRLLRSDGCFGGFEAYFCVSSVSNESVSIDFYSLSAEYNSSSSASGGSSEGSSVAPLSDFLTLSVDFVEDVVVGSSYNFSLGVVGRQVGNDSDFATLSVVLPGGLVVEEFAGFTQYDQGVYVDALLNETSSYWVVYRVQSPPIDSVRLFAEAEVNRTPYLEEFVYSFGDLVASPLRVEAGFSGFGLPVREDFPVSVRVVNDNSFPVDVSFAARSILVDFEDSVEVPANASREVDFVLFANRSGSFGVSVFLEYELLGQSFSLREFFGVSSDEEVESDESSALVVDNSSLVSAPGVSGPRALLRGPSELSGNESGLLTFSAQGLPVGAGVLSWLREGDVFFVDNVSVVDGSLLANQFVSRDGSYQAVLVVEGVEVSSSFIVSWPASQESFEVSSEPELVESGGWWSWFFVLGFLVVLVVGLWLVWRVRATRFEESLLEDYEVVLSWHPRSQQEVVVREQLLAELRRALEENS